MFDPWHRHHCATSAGEGQEEDGGDQKSFQATQLPHTTTAERDPISPLPAAAIQFCCLFTAFFLFCTFKKPHTPGVPATFPSMIRQLVTIFTTPPAEPRWQCIRKQEQPEQNPVVQCKLLPNHNSSNVTLSPDCCAQWQEYTGGKPPLVQVHALW